MEFNTEICTNKEQSKRLIDLGLNPNTSDMHHYRWSEGYWDIQNCPPRGSNSNFIPAWSLHRLIAMLPDEVKMLPEVIKNIPDETKKLSMATTINCFVPKLTKNYVFYTDWCGWTKIFNENDNMYDNIIDCIEWLIKENHFNKEYLKKED